MIPGRYVCIAMAALIIVIAMPWKCARAEPRMEQAMECARQLMGGLASYPDSWIKKSPGPNFCKASGRENCTGAFIVWASGETTIIAAPWDFGVLVHEACHAIQHGESRYLDEAECEAVEKRVIECLE